MATLLVNTEIINTAPMQPHCSSVCERYFFHKSDRGWRRAAGKDELVFVCTWLFLRPLTLAFQSYTQTHMPTIHNLQRSDHSTYYFTSLSPQSCTLKRHKNKTKIHYSSIWASKITMSKCVLGDSGRNKQMNCILHVSLALTESISREGLKGFNWH